MKKIAVFLAEGFEEIEALTVVDVLRRAGLECKTVGVTGMEVTGSHGIPVKVDVPIIYDLSDFDMIVLPGGLPGATNLRANPYVIEYVKAFAADPSKFVAAICAAPQVLYEAGISTGRTLTSYPGANFDEMFADANYVQDAVVVDGNIITSRGPFTALAFAYQLVDLLGGDSETLKKAMLYRYEL